jgi:hypothetical protein
MASDRQKRVRHQVNELIRRSAHDGRRLWRYFRHGDTKSQRLARARGVLFVARHRQNAAAHRANVANYRLTHADDLTAKQKDRLRRIRKQGWEAHAKWGKFRPVYRRQVKRLKQRIADTGEPGDTSHFELWMLNGHSSNISDGTKQLVAHVVGVQGGTITDTYDFGGHDPSSNHYPWNNADGKGHAIDWVPAACSQMTGVRDHFGAGFFKELFGPCPYYYRYGQQYQGMFPGHGDHEHGAPVS